MSVIKVGLIGGGTVALSFLELVKQLKQPIEVSAILIADAGKPRDFNGLPYTDNAESFLQNYTFDVLVDASTADEKLWPLVKRSLENGVPFVSANKKWLVDQFEDFHNLALQTQVPLLYEAACAGAIPILKNLNDYYRSIPIKSIKGIINGSCNYILSEMEKGLPYQDALIKAQKKGYAEANPVLDVSGEDARNKLLLLIYHAFGLKLNRQAIDTKGIEQLRPSDFSRAKAQGKTIKLVAEAKLVNGELFATVKPKLLDKSVSLAQANGVQNIVEVASFDGQLGFFLGDGAGGHPTAQALLSDVIAASKNYRYNALRTLERAC